MGITNHIHQAAKSRHEYDEAFLRIVNEIQAEVRRYVASNYPKGMNGLPSVTDFVQQTFDKLQQNMSEDREAFLGMTTDEFMVTIRRIAHSRIRDAKKSKSTKLHTTGDVPLQHAHSNGKSPEAQVSDRDLAVLILSLLLSEQDPMEGLVSVLGLGMNFSLRDIEETLRRSNDGAPVFSDSKISRILNRARERVRKKLKELGEGVVGPYFEE
ncbi:hypothetical protein SH449x_000164 [Pirellulaceae bacterium SH449]